MTALQRALDSDGLQTELRLPDDDDPLGGPLLVRLPGADEGASVDIVEVVNFRNPGRLSPTPALAAIARAEPLPGSSLRCVTLEDLVALKLYAGGRTDLADVENLIANNPDADLDAIRTAAGPYDRDGELEALISAARSLGH